jgi:hypothetical protein
MLAGADGRRGWTVMSFTRVGAGIAAAVAIALIGGLLLLALIRPPSPRVGDPVMTASPGPVPTASALAGTPSPAPSAPPTTPGNPGPSATPVGATTGPSCTLTWSVGRVEGAAGSRYINVDVTNEAGTCDVAELLEVRITAGDGSVVAASDAAAGGRFQIPAGGHATGFVQWTNWCGAGAPAEPLTLVVRDAGRLASLALNVPSGPPPCTSRAKPSSLTQLQLSLVP